MIIITGQLTQSLFVEYSGSAIIIQILSADHTLVSLFKPKNALEKRDSHFHTEKKSNRIPWGTYIAFQKRVQPRQGQSEVVVYYLSRTLGSLNSIVVCVQSFPGLTFPMNKFVSRGELYYKKVMFPARADINMGETFSKFAFSNDFSN